MTKKLRKKGMISATAGVGALITLIVGVGICVLVLIFMGVMSGQTYSLQQDNLEALAYNASGFTTVYGTNQSYLGYPSIYSVTYAWNESGTNQSIPLTEFTFDYVHGYVQGAGGEPFLNGSSVRFDFIVGNQEIEDNVKLSATNAFLGLSQTAAYMPLIVLAVVITLVLALVFSMGLGLGGKGGKGGGGAL